MTPEQTRQLAFYISRIYAQVDMAQLTKRPADYDQLRLMLNVLKRNIEQPATIIVARRRVRIAKEPQP